MTNTTATAISTAYELAESIEWGEIEQYYHDSTEISRKRESWESDGRAWTEERDAAIEAAKAGDTASAKRSLESMRATEDEWGDFPATRNVAEALGIEI